MMNLLKSIRMSNRKGTFSKALFQTTMIFSIGILLGAVSKLLDIYTSHLGNIFSQISVWIFLCTIISILSSTPFKSAIHVFSFCIGMLLAYYITAACTSSIYSTLFIYGWTLLALLSPVLGFCTWYAKGKGILSNIIGAFIIFVMLVTSVILFDKIRVADMIFAVLTGFVLLKK